MPIEAKPLDAPSRLPSAVAPRDLRAWTSLLRELGEAEQASAHYARLLEAATTARDRLRAEMADRLADEGHAETFDPATESVALEPASGTLLFSARKE